MPRPMPDSARKAVLITGAAKRVGAAIALHFAQAGWDVALHYHRSQTEAKNVAHSITSLGREALLLPADLQQSAEILPLIKRAKQALPQLCALVNNASVFTRQSFMQTNEALLAKQFAVNFVAPFFATQAFAAQVAHGTIVNLIDTDITRTHGSHFAYLLSKKSLAELTRMSARELGPNIRVNAVCPGVMLGSDELEVAYEEKMRELSPLKANATVEQTAQAVYFLTTQPGLTGQFLFVDGGKHVVA